MRDPEFSTTVVLQFTSLEKEYRLNWSLVNQKKMFDLNGSHPAVLQLRSAPIGKVPSIFLPGHGGKEPYNEG